MTATATAAETPPTGAPWILGTTETVTSIDPAGSYDFGSWNIQYNIFQQLMTVPANGAEPEPDAGRVVRVRRPADDHLHAAARALKFSNGDDLTSSDVLFSFQRNIEIADPNGSSVLLGSISNGDDEEPRPWPTARSRRPTTRRWSSTSTSPTRPSCRS